MMKSRKGRFTVPNLITGVFLLFLFSVFFKPMSSAFPSISQASGVSGILTATVLNTLPAVILLTILSSPFILAERRRIIDEQRRGGRR